jgi:elongation factor Ts
MNNIAISAADVNKLRQMTGAGMMDCKKALAESNGDFEAAIDFLRKKGQKIAVNRSDREAKEGFVLAKTSSDAKKGVLVMVNCETDFVAKNQDFVDFVNSLTDLAISSGVTTVDDLKTQKMGDLTVSDKLFDMIGKIGEKIDITRCEVIEGDKVVVYNHPGNRLVSMVALNKVDIAGVAEIGKDIAMQIAAMSPVSIDKDDVDPEMLSREIEIAKEQARQEGKPEEMLEKIAMGKLNKFYKENTLLNQTFIKNEDKTVGQVLADTDKALKVLSFRRVGLA